MNDEAKRDTFWLFVIWLCMFVILCGVASMSARAQPTGPASLPGTVEAENFDVGGDGVGYHDTDATNNGGAYRTTEGVDISLGDGGLVVSNFDTGEWLRFTVNVAQAGSYEIRLRAAAGEGDATYSFVVDNGAPITLTAPNTGSYTTFALSAPGVTVNLPAGQHQIVLTSLAKWADVNWWSATLITAPPPPIPPPVLTGSETLTWTAPTKNTDGSALTDLAGFSVYVGSAPGVYTRAIHNLAPTMRSYIVSGLASGTWYSAVTASNLLGDESAKSNEVSKVIPPEVALFPAAPTAVTATPSVIPNVPGANVSVAWGVTSAGARASNALGLVPVGKGCQGPVLFTYRNQSYMRFNPDDGLWWGTAKTANAAVACR